MAKNKSQEPEQQAAAGEDARVEITGDNATLLLAAAEELNLEASVVKVENNQFVVPAEVAKKAGVDTIKDEEPEPAAQEAPAENTGE
jgi:hypothetical protein